MLYQYQPEIIKDDINDLPLYKYEGEIVLVDSENSMRDALAVLEQEEVLGFDTETKPTFRKGDSHDPALIQLASSSAVYLFQLRKLPFGQEVAALLEKAVPVKSGVAIGDDMRFLQRLHPFTPAGMVDLGTIARQRNIKMQGLRGLTAVFMGVRISKSARCSNWNKLNLTDQQISYAATDAWVSRQIYLAMQAHKLL